MPHVPRPHGAVRLLFALIAAAVIAGLIAVPSGSAQGGKTAAALAFDGERALMHTRDVVAFGPRPAGSAALEQTRQYIESTLGGFGFAVTRDEFVAATPKGELIAGLKSKRCIPRLPELARDGGLGDQLKVMHPHAGQALFCPAGAVHASGPGIVFLEVQQNSDTTFRLYDWGRVGLDGKPRELHVEAAMAAIGDRATRVVEQTPRTVRKMPFPATRLVSCDKFVMDRWRLTEPLEFSCDGRCHIISVLEGELTIEGDPTGEPVSFAQTALLPADLESVRLIPDGEVTLLDAFLP